MCSFIDESRPSRFGEGRLLCTFSRRYRRVLSQLARGWRDEVLGCELASTQESTESAEFTRLHEPPRRGARGSLAETRL